MARAQVTTASIVTILGQSSQQKALCPKLLEILTGPRTPAVLRSFAQGRIAEALYISYGLLCV